MQTHENVSTFRKVVLGSNRKFGLTFGAIFALFGIWPLLHAHSPKWVFVALAVAFAATALLRPRWLTPLNRGWFKLGLILNQIVNPIIMGIMFFAAVTPLAWYLRKKGNDLLSLEMKPEAETYWIERQPALPGQGALTKQF
jgi:predicted membrane metal-binding protein